MFRDEIKEKYGDKLKKSYDAPTGEVVSAVFSAMTAVPVEQPANFKR